MDAHEEVKLVQRVAERLSQKHSTVPIEVIVTVVNDAHIRFDGSRIRDFVPLLVERIAKEKLRGSADA